jgi:hypothetical protein
LFDEQAGPTARMANLRINPNSGAIEGIAPFDEMPRHTLYSKADALEDQVLFPEEFENIGDSTEPEHAATGKLNGKQKTLDPTPLTQLKTRDRQWEERGPEMTRFVYDLSTDEEMSDPDEIKNSRKSVSKILSGNTKGGKVERVSELEPPELEGDQYSEVDDSREDDEFSEGENSDDDEDKIDTGEPRTPNMALLEESPDVDLLIHEMHRSQGNDGGKAPKMAQVEAYWKEFSESDILHIIKAWLPKSLGQIEMEENMPMDNLMHGQFMEFVDRERANSKSLNLRSSCNPSARFSVLRIWSCAYFYPLMIGLNKDQRQRTSFMDPRGRTWDWKFIPKDMGNSESSMMIALQKAT